MSERYDIIYLYADSTSSITRRGNATQYADEDISPSHRQKNDSKSWKMIAGVAAAIVLVIGGIFLFPKLLKSNDNKDDSSNNQSSAVIGNNSEANDNSGSEQATTINTNNELAEEAKTKTLNEAQKYADSGDYKSAIALIKEAQNTYGDNEEYTSALDTYCTAYKTEVISQSDEMANNEDYIGAIQKLSEAIVVIGEDSDLSSKKEAYESTYVSGITGQADALIATGEFDEAGELIDSALTKLPENASLNAEKEKIESAKPVYLLSVLSPYETPYWYKSDGIISMGGKDYTNGFTCMGYGDSPVGNETYFNLNGEYSYLSFTAGIVDRNRSKGEVGFTFYADGELIYGFKMESSELPTEHIVDVTGCKQLKIAIYDGYWVADGSGTYGLADIKITRNLSGSTTEKAKTDLADGEVYLLNEIDPYDKPYYYKADGMLSMGGQTYLHGFSCMGYGDSPVGNETYFNLEGKYSKLSFTTGIVSNNRSDNDVTFTFYADGEIVDSIKMKSNELPSSHTIDITGCKQLKITVYDGYWVADGSGTYGLSDIILTKS